MSLIVDVADAIVSKLNTMAFSLPLTAVRAYRPVFTLEDLATLRVTVVPKSLLIKPGTRSACYYECAVDIAVQRKIDPAATEAATIDPLMDLTQEIADCLRLAKLDALPELSWIALANDPIWAPEHLDQQGVFTSLLTVTYWCGR